MSLAPDAPLRHLVVVLGDQLDQDSSAFDGFDPAQDAVWMAEVEQESTHVASTKARIVLFLAAMRHFARELRERGWTVLYRHLDDAPAVPDLAQALAADIRRHRPRGLVMAAPGDWRVLRDMRACAASQGVPLDIREDRHFYSTVREFAAHARARKQLRLEYWYRELRQRHAVLMDGAKPCGGRWNYDDENRDAFPAAGPQELRQPLRFEPDSVTRQVITLVHARFSSHAGSLQSFGWPVARAQAQQALDDFIDHRLASFGRWQDAMWTDQPWLNHSLVSSSLNLKLIGARQAVAAAEAAWRSGSAPLASVEGFIRQILGWREYVRGIYWTRMPAYGEANELAAQASLPAFYWTAQTDMACLRAVIGQTLEHGYAHHIQRLMVTGLYALLLGVRPQEVHEWYLAVYVDAVEWVELPNTLGMSQHADGGVMASKPYVASGKYIQRMSNYCQGCRFNPAVATGETACPFTTLYWDFLLRHRNRFAGNPRMTMQIRNLDRMDTQSQQAIAQQAREHRDRPS